jgi:hypothetical protein
MEVKKSYFPTCGRFRIRIGIQIPYDADPRHCLRVEEKYGQSLGTEAKYCFICLYLTPRVCQLTTDGRGWIHIQLYVFNTTTTEMS